MSQPRVQYADRINVLQPGGFRDRPFCDPRHFPPATKGATPRCKPKEAAMVNQIVIWTVAAAAALVVGAANGHGQ